MKKSLFITVFMVILVVLIAGCTPTTVIQVNTPDANSQAGTPAPNGQIDVPGVSIQIYAPSPNPLTNTPDANGHIASILLGLWHGVISPVTLIMSFFNPTIQMYEVYNDGSQYNLGFLLGVAVVFIILGALLGSRRRR